MTHEPPEAPDVVPDPWHGRAVRDDLNAALPPDFAAFYHLHVRAYLRYADLQLGSAEEAEKAVEDFFCAMSARWPQVLTEPSVPGWAWAAFKQDVARRVAARGRGPALVETAAFAALRDYSRATMETLDSSLGLYEAVAALPERLYDVVVLCCVLGLKQQRVAELMGISYPTVRSHLRTARRRIARDINYTRYLESEEDHDEPG
ncbi:sigma-70 family RNA polymerase sigma factor [Streptomyces sp. NPDC051940]|uniref:RNA polymerase sigma factor n=1 Tax=Streptomyces sp. NPDC051940 TaxID=3155675 RepID=UPI0034412780